MGSTVCAAVAGDPELELVAAVDPYHAGIDLAAARRRRHRAAGRRATPTRSPTPASEVAVDFTVLDAAREQPRVVRRPRRARGRRHDRVLRRRPRRPRARASTRATANAVIAPNFAIGAVLMMRFAELAAPYFETAEIIELHHDEKIDAPSGTAMLTAQRMADASTDWARRPDREAGRSRAHAAREGPAGSACTRCGCGASSPTRRCCSGTTGQSLSIRHDSYDRTSFMPGRAAGDPGGARRGPV